MKPLRIGLVGLGTVGSGVARILLDESVRMARRAGQELELVGAAVRHLDKPRDVNLSPERLTDNPQALLADDSIDVIVELIGGTDVARDVVLDALRAGKHVVTANKALLCEHGPEVFAAARDSNRCIAFEAAVAGGCPIIHVLGQALSSNQITAIEAILNGTSNFILTEMLSRDQGYEDAVRRAQELGYAEADPSMDVQGTDAAQKLTLLTQLAFGTRVPLDDFIVQGIDTIELADLTYADELGYAVKLLATARLTGGQLELHTQPTLVRHERPLAQVDGPYNMIAVVGDALGPSWYSGPGAGQMATASAVVSDLIDVAVGRAQLTFPRLDIWGNGEPIPVLPADRLRRRYYLRFQAEDRPHVMADITDRLGRNGISIASVIQHEAPEPDQDDESGAPIVPLVIMTHRTSEGQMRQADEEIAELSCIRPPRVRMPVSDA